MRKTKCSCRFRKLALPRMCNYVKVRKYIHQVTYTRFYCVQKLHFLFLFYRSTAMKDMTVEHLCSLLKFALKRMIKCTTVSNFFPGKVSRFFLLHLMCKVLKKLLFCTLTKKKVLNLLKLVSQNKCTYNYNKKFIISNKFFFIKNLVVVYGFCRICCKNESFF